MTLLFGGVVRGYPRIMCIFCVGRIRTNLFLHSFQFFDMTGLPMPQFLKYLRDNKGLFIMLTVIIGGVAQQLVSTGAFEVFYKGEESLFQGWVPCWQSCSAGLT